MGGRDEPIFSRVIDGDASIVEGVAGNWVLISGAGGCIAGSGSWSSRCAVCGLSCGAVGGPGCCGVGGGRSGGWGCGGGPVGWGWPVGWLRGWPVGWLGSG